MEIECKKYNTKGVGMSQEVQQLYDPNPHEGPDRDNPPAPGLPVALTLLVIVVAAVVLIAKAFS